MLRVLALPNSEKLDNRIFQEILSFLDEDEQNKILKFRKWHDAQGSLLGHFLVRVSLCELLKVKNSDLRILKGKMGKPYVHNFPGISFNITHSGEWVVGAFDDMRVGVDIEGIRDIDFDMAGKILDTEDYEDMLKEKESQRAFYFYKCWTLNESYIKMQGEGISFPLIRLKKLTKAAFFRVYSIDPGYLLAVCSLCNEFPENIILTDTEELIQTIKQING